MKFISVFNYGFDLLMINQWENVGKLKCPIPTEIFPDSTTISSMANSTEDSLATTTTSVLSDLVFNDYYNKAKPLYCVEDGAEILDDLKIRPVHFHFMENIF